MKFIRDWQDDCLLRTLVPKSHKKTHKNREVDGKITDKQLI